MTGITTSSIHLCPINFKELSKINERLNNLDACLLFSKLRFHQLNSQLRKDNETWIARSREEISSWFNFSPKKTDRLLTLLQEKGMLKKKVRTWYGKRMLFISTNNFFNLVPINYKLLKSIMDQTGCLTSALLLSKIAYSFANTRIEKNKLKWCCIKKSDLSKWIGKSIRTIDKTLEVLLRKGLILKKNFFWDNRTQSHYHIPNFAIECLKNKPQDFIEQEIKLQDKRTSSLKQKPVAFIVPNTSIYAAVSENANGQNCRLQPANLTISIKTRTKRKKTNNITRSQKLFTSEGISKSDIIFNKIENELTAKQIYYLKAAINNTTKRNKLRISCPEDLLEEIKFSIINKEQRKGVTTFPHAVSRCMKILADNNWRTPLGFHNHSAMGFKIRADKQSKILMWEKEKEADKQAANIFSQNNTLTTSLLTNTVQVSSPSNLTNEAIKYASQLIRATTEVFKKKNGFSAHELVENITRRIEWLIKRGADKSTVLDYLIQNSPSGILSNSPSTNSYV